MIDCGRIFLVDGDAFSREVVRGLLEAGDYVDVVELETGEEALVLAGEERPKLVMLEVVLPGISGYEVCRQLRDRFGERLPIVFVSGTRTEAHDRVAGLMIGADDYIVKPFAPDELVARVLRLMRTGEDRPNGNADAGLASRLTEREREVLVLLAEGLTQDAIAAQLYISPKTVGTHIQRTLMKLDVHSRAEAVALAYRLGIVQPEVTAHALPL